MSNARRVCAPACMCMYVRVGEHLCICVYAHACVCVWCMSGAMCVLCVGGGYLLTGMEVFPQVNIGYGCTRDWTFSPEAEGHRFPVLVFSPGTFMKGLGAPKATLFHPPPPCTGAPSSHLGLHPLITWMMSPDLSKPQFARLWTGDNDGPCLQGCQEDSVR